MTGSPPSDSDLDHFSIALRGSRERAGDPYDGRADADGRDIRAELFTVLEELTIAEEGLRVQHEALREAQGRVEVERERYRGAEESMHALNASLNARVAQRTRELELALEEEQAARRKAEAANRIKSELFARLSHEFRTPLHAVSGYLEILQDNIHGGLTSDQRRDIDRIHQAQDHLLTLVNMVLDFAKIESGPIELILADVPIEETLCSVEGLVAPQFAKKGVSYRHQAGDCAVTAYADREKVQQIIVNLLANAAKFTAPGGSVEIEGKVEEELALVCVRDTGDGIPEDKIEQIFEPFVQLRAPGSARTEGTGLGLAISRDLARAMGGDVRVTSELGVGSEFILVLPRWKSGAGPKPLSAPQTDG